MGGSFSSSLIVVVALVGLVPSGASAQTALLVTTTDGTTRDVEGGIADGLRDGLGVSVRRVDPSLDDLALAAGCAERPDSAACVSRVATASSARLVALEEVAREGSVYRVSIDLRRGSDGASIRVLRLTCTSSGECQSRLTALLEGEDEAVAAAHLAATPRSSTSTGSGDSRDRLSSTSEATSRVDPTPVWRGAPVVPLVLFATAVLASVGSMVAGGAAISADQARGVIAASAARRDQEVMGALDRNVAVSLGVGTGFALVGACLAGAGALVYALSPHTSADSAHAPHVSVAADGTGAMVSLGASF